MRYRLTLLLGIILSLTSLGIVLAQSTCPTIVEDALQAIGDNCDELGRNSACYGYNLVTAEFTEAVDESFFSQPTDIAELAMLESIHTSEMNMDSSQWGVALMSLQANIPNSIPGQSVKFVLLGDVEVESALEPASVFQNATSLDATLISAANIRSGPGLNYNVIGGGTAKDVFPIDGQSADGDWYRTILGNRIAWIFGELLESNDSLASLPVIDGTQRSLMQSFYLRTGFGAPACEEAPQDTLIIQGPHNIAIDLTVNGAAINIGSTIIIRILSPGNIMEFTVIDGKLVVPGAGLNGKDLIVYENYRTTACLGEPDDRGVDGSSNDREVECGWTSPEFIPDFDLGNLFCVLENVPDNILNYRINLPCGGDAAPPSPSSPLDGSTDTLNLCFAGNEWGDGRCNSDYWWEAGYFLGLYHAGRIAYDDIPPEYLPSDDDTGDDGSTDATDKPEDKKPKYCQQDLGRFYEVYNKSTGALIKRVTSDPGYPKC